MSYKTICSICGGDKMAGECACPLTQQELEHLANLDATMKVISIKDLKERINISNVVAVLDIGNVLIRIKDSITLEATRI